MSSTISPPTPSVDANKAVVRSFVDAWNSRDFDRFDELMADGAVLHVGGGVVPVRPVGHARHRRRVDHGVPGLALRPASP